MKKIARELARSFPDKYVTVDMAKMYNMNLELTIEYSVYFEVNTIQPGSMISPEFNNIKDLDRWLQSNVPGYKMQHK